jgi:hypothetical protein
MEEKKVHTVGERIEICKNCEDLSAVKTCKHCGCFMPIKLRFKWMKCPIGKWGPVPKE